MATDPKAANPVPPPELPEDYFRFHLPHAHLGPVFGNDWFALKAEGFARFFGTPVFLVSQTVIVAFWIAINAFNDRFGDFSVTFGSLLSTEEKGSHVISPAWRPDGIRNVDVK